MAFFRCLLAITVFAAAVVAQDPSPAASTGQEGQLIPAPFPTYSVTGPRAKFVHDLFVEHELDPTVAIIAARPPEKPSEPFAVLLQKLETLAAENRPVHFGAFAIFASLEKPLSDDPTGGAAVGSAEGLAKDLKLKEVVLGVDYLANAPLAAYGIDKEKFEKDNQVVVLVYNRHKIERRFVFSKDKPLTDAASAEILAAAEKTLPPARKKKTSK
jgi:hypothetical protein